MRRVAAVADQMVEYGLGEKFPGTIGKTIDDSKEAWPVPKRAADGTPNVLFYVLDDTGFGQLSPYGGLIDVPNLERVAKKGVMYTNMHTTGLCSPTRACILTGRNHHKNAMGSISEWSTGYPGYNARAPFESGFLSEILKDEGFNTYCVGKWHLAVSAEASAAGPYDTWPLGRGFERFYGFLPGETDQWYPDLTYDNHSVAPPDTPDNGYHLSKDIADKAIEFIGDAKVNAPEKPFFLYYAPGCGHAPITSSKRKPTPTRASSTWGGTSTATPSSRTRRSSASSPTTPRCPTSIPMWSTGTTCPTTRRSCTPG